MVADRRGVRVVHGANDGFFEVAGVTIRSLQDSLADAFNIPDDAIALANGQRVPDSYQLRRDDMLEFVRECGQKAGRKKATAAQPDDDDDKDEDRVAPPDFSAMDLDGLAAFIDGRLASSYEAERRSLLQANKSAVHLFWAGAALYEARAKCEKEGRGEWTAYKKEHGFKDTTTNDAIRLFENAKTPAALAGLGVTEAKEKFVYPAKKGSDQKSTDLKPNSPKTKGGSRPGKLPPASEGPAPTKSAAVTQAEDAELEKDDGNLNVIDSTVTLAETLEVIAQDLNDIVQDDMGKVDWNGAAATRLENAIAAVESAAAKLTRRMNNDRSDS